MLKDQLWKLFEATGAINYYLFYRALRDETDEDEPKPMDDMPLADAH